MVRIGFWRIVLTLLAVETLLLIYLEIWTTVRPIKQQIDTKVGKVSWSTDSPLQNDSFYNDSAVEKRNGPRYELYGNEELTFTKHDHNDACVKEFRRTYTEYCKRAHVPDLKYQKNYHLTNSKHHAAVLCPCISPHLKRNVYAKSLNQNKSNDDYHPELHPGGHWRPTWCIPRQRIAIIVPYRDRPEHLSAFLTVIHPFLQRQLHYYTIFVVEQRNPWIFNKATLMNVGFMEAAARDEFDCLIFHDVDLIPEDDLNYYGCYKTARHVGVYIDRHDYKIWYADLFGGATAFTPNQFESLNGYSNEFYGWGGEDDDMLSRVVNANLSIIRFPNCVARYTSLKHERDTGNPVRYNNIAFEGSVIRPDVYKVNGLNSLSYSVVHSEEKILYTWFVVNLPDAPPPGTNFTTVPPPVEHSVNQQRVNLSTINNQQRH